MKKQAYCAGLILLFSCNGPIYENSSYSLYADKVVQGEYTSVAESPDRIVSNLNGEEYIWERKNDISDFPELVTPWMYQNLINDNNYEKIVLLCNCSIGSDGMRRTGGLSTCGSPASVQ